MNSKQNIVLIVGAGPAGLTAAYELLARSNGFHPVVFEKGDYLGGISGTHNYKGNRIDIGGHRFFSKSDQVMDWWIQFMPLQNGVSSKDDISYHGDTRSLPSAATAETRNPNQSDLVMLVRKRLSRIFYLRKFFDYPIRLNRTTINNLGLVRMVRIAGSYLWASLFPIKPEVNLEQFLTNRFGRELYRTFFQSYTEKVWGVPCHQIGSEWGVQRIKGLSVAKTLFHACKRRLYWNSANIRQKQLETSLIEKFLYPKFGPGQLWEEVARQIREKGGEILLNQDVIRVMTVDNKIAGVEVRDQLNGQTKTYRGDYFVSSMPVKDLVSALDCDKPGNVVEVAQGLIYRDFITVGLLLKKFKVPSEQNGSKSVIRDCWIYVQEPDVRVGRIQVFNNWSPYMIKDPAKIWVGLEYFCAHGDALWQKPDAEMIQLGAEEMQRMGFIEPGDVLDATVIRMEKTYPAYFGTYERFGEVRAYLESFSNLFLIGRNGMHRYNNQDHSMLTAMKAVDLILSGNTDKTSIWAVNAEQQYHEQKS